MNETPAPPVLRPRWRWALHLGVLLAYVLGLGLVGVFFHEKPGGSVEAAMPRDLRGLALMCAADLGLFGLVFALACFFSRARREELFLSWRHGLRPILLGIGYSIGLRVAVMVVMALTLVPYLVIKGEKELGNVRPKIEAVVDTEALKDPAYLLFTLTVLSFGLAGFREELWRAGVIAGFAGLAPGLFSSRKGQCVAVVIAALIFGLGHLPQGWGGVFLTATLGLGLGLIIVWHRSIWEAVLAHGFFDATSFAMLYVIATYAPQILKGIGIAPN